MENLKYKVIKTEEQYYEYCDGLEKLLFSKAESLQDEIDLLTLLIEKWDDEHNTFEDIDPIQLLQSLMEEHALKSKDLVEITGLTKGMVSKILNYQKGLSKESIRKLSAYFKVSQEAFNRSYALVAHQEGANRKSNKRLMVST